VERMANVKEYRCARAPGPCPMFAGGLRVLHCQGRVCFPVGSRRRLYKGKHGAACRELAAVTGGCPALPGTARHCPARADADPRPASLLLQVPATLSKSQAARAGRRRASARSCAATARWCCPSSSGRTTRACAAASASCTRSSSRSWRGPAAGACARHRLGPGSARRPLAACLQGCGSESGLVLMSRSADRGVCAASGNALPADASRCGESLVWRACSMAGRDALSQHHQMAHLLPTKCGNAAALLHFPIDGHCCARHARMRARS